MPGVVRPWFTVAVEASPLGPVATGASLALAIPVASWAGRV
jgi:hypothetical protein